MELNVYLKEIDDLVKDIPDPEQRNIVLTDYFRSRMNEIEACDKEIKAREFKKLEAAFNRTLSGAISRLRVKNTEKRLRWEKQKDTPILMGKIPGTPFRFLPNVANISIQLQGVDEIFKFWNISKNLECELEIEPYKSKRFNRYLHFQFKRLSKYTMSGPKWNPNKYFTIALHLLKRSHILRVMGFRHVLPKWHRELSMGEVFWINRSISKIINDNLTKLDFKRIYIKKGDKGHRPLGVPSKPWRIYLHLLNGFLLHYLQSEISSSQHAFQSGKGPITAWREFFKYKIHDYKYIMSCDLKNFFGEVNIPSVSEALKQYKVPTSIIHRLESINLSTPELPPEELLNEDIVKNRNSIFSDIEKGIPVKSSYFEELIDHIGRSKLIQIMNEWGATSMQEAVGIYHAINEGNVNLGHLNKGVPQGAPTSPLLAILVLPHFLHQSFTGLIKKLKKSKLKYLLYADDIVFYSNSPISLENDNERGVIINREKTAYDKENGKWLRPFKFLGLVWDRHGHPNLEIDKVPIRAETRNGSRVTLPEKFRSIVSTYDLAEFHASIPEVLSTLPELKTPYFDPNNLNCLTWTKTLEHWLFGSGLARLYKGSFESSSVYQNFRLTFAPKSWLGRKDPTYLNTNKLTVFNSSSFANYHLSVQFYWNAKMFKLTQHLKFKNLKLPVGIRQDLLNKQGPYQHLVYSSIDFYMPSPRYQPKAISTNFRTNIAYFHKENILTLKVYIHTFSTNKRKFKSLKI